MVWKQIQMDDTKDNLIMIQNSSILPLSIVYINVSTDPEANPDNTFILTGPNNWKGRIPMGVNCFVAAENGGIPTYVVLPIEKLVNYDIPTIHEDITANNQTIECVEGTYVTLQNKSKTDMYFTVMTGESNSGLFTLVQNQMISLTFARDSRIRLKGTGQNVSYMIAQSPNVTMLSEKTQKMLDEMKASIDMLMENAVMRPELDVVRKQMTHGKWSPRIVTTGTNTDSIRSGNFKQDEEYHSEFVDDGDLLNGYAKLEIGYMSGNSAIIEVAELTFTMDIKDGGVTNKLADFFTDSKFLQEHLKKITYTRDLTNNMLNILFTFDTTLETVTLVTRVREDNTKFIEDVTTEMLPHRITEYNVDKFNYDIFFTDESFYSRMLELFAHAADVPKLSTSEGELTLIDNSDSTIESYLIMAAEKSTGVTFARALDDSNAYLSVRIPMATEATKILGVNFKLVDKKKTGGLFMDTIIMSDGLATRSLVENWYEFTIPMYKHTNFGFKHLFEHGIYTLDVNDMSKYYIEIVYI